MSAVVLVTAYLSLYTSLWLLAFQGNWNSNWPGSIFRMIVALPYATEYSIIAGFCVAIAWSLFKWLRDRPIKP